MCYTGCMEPQPANATASKTPTPEAANTGPDPIVPGVDPGVSPVSEVTDEKEVQEWASYLRKVAKGGEPFSAIGGNRPVKVSEYGYAAASHLAHLLGMSRKEVITLALCHYARALTSAPVVTQHDLAMLTKGMQFVVQDLTLEVAEMSKLALAVADQESVLGPNVIP